MSRSSVQIRSPAPPQIKAWLLSSFDQDAFDLCPLAAGANVVDHNRDLLEQIGITPTGPDVEWDPAPQLGGFILERVVRVHRTLVLKDSAHLDVQGAFARGGGLYTIEDPDILVAELLEGHWGFWARQFRNFPLAVRLVEHRDHDLLVSGRMIFSR